MRIVHLACVAPPEIGGIGTVAATEVAGLRARGVDAHLVSLTSHPSYRLGNAGRVIGLRHIVGGCDAVHLHYPFFGTAEAVARMRERGEIRRLAVTFHMDAVAGGLKGRAFDAYRRYFQNRILDAADRILVSSKDYALQSSINMSERKITELPFGVDEHVFCPASNPADRIANQILFVGGMDTAHAFKGVDLLLDALRGLPDARCVFVGEGNMRGGYEKRAAELGIADRVAFRGKLERNDLVRAYQTSAVLAFPSMSRAEAFGLVALEAQACGTPVVASDLPGVRTVVRDGETGYLFPIGDTGALRDALRKILSDTELRGRMGTRSREYVLERFTWDRHMDGLVRVYHELCGSPS